MAELADQDWHARGICTQPGMNPDWWFPKQGEDAGRAKDLCATCPVKPECLEFGMTQRFGIWGGLSERERRRIRSQRARERGAA